jgi:hypothetical protein
LDCSKCSIVFTNIIMLLTCFLEKSVYALLSFGVILIVHATAYVGYYCNKMDVSLVVSVFLLASVMTVLKNVFQPIKIRFLFILFVWLVWDMHLYIREDPNSDLTKHIC